MIFHNNRHMKVNILNMGIALYRSFKVGYLFHPQCMIFVTLHNHIRLEGLVHIQLRVLFPDSQRTFM